MARYLVLLLMFLGFTGFAQDEGLQQREGYLETSEGKIWYKVVGSGDRTPLLLLHGGPGFSTYYMEPLAALSKDRPVVFFDQLGSGRSDVTHDPALWTIEKFVQQVALVRTSLHLDEVYILGHSWGTQLAIEYMQTNPTGVRGLVLASPAINVPRWIADNKALLAAMPEDVNRAIETHEREGTTDSPEYQDAMMVFYHQHISRSDPWSADLLRAFETANLDLYGYMWGPADWTATGTLKDYNREDLLPKLTVPVLFTAGRYDEARPDTLAHFQSLVPGAELVIFENSGHITMQDEPDEYNRVVGTFLNKVDGSSDQ
jgi:proline iminopeptidase